MSSPPLPRRPNEPSPEPSHQPTCAPACPDSGGACPAPPPSMRVMQSHARDAIAHPSSPLRALLARHRPCGQSTREPCVHSLHPCTTTAKCASPPPPTATTISTHSALQAHTPRLISPPQPLNRSRQRSHSWDRPQISEPIEVGSGPILRTVRKSRNLITCGLSCCRFGICCSVARRARQRACARGCVMWRRRC